MERILIEHIEGQLRAQGDEVSVARDDDLVMVGLDSIGFVRLIDFIDFDLGVKVPVQQITVDKFGTVGRIVQYLEGLLDE